jgi:lysozyme
MTTPALFTDLERDEGCRLHAYQDGGGVWTIGYGHTGREVHGGLSWTPVQAMLTLQSDVAATRRGLDTAMPWWATLDDVRQDVLANMAFNMGVHGLMNFGKTLADVRAGNYSLASAEMLLSDWAKDAPVGVGPRATRLAAMMKTGARAGA